MTPRQQGFSLVELLVTIAVIAILTGLVITSISNAAGDARMVTARQQQAVLQDALNAWISAASSGAGSLSSAQATYSAATTPAAKLALLQNYLQADSYAHFTANSTATQIRSDAMTKAGVYLQFSAWVGTGYPSVEMIK